MARPSVHDLTSPTAAARGSALFEALNLSFKYTMLVDEPNLGCILADSDANTGGDEHCVCFKLYSLLRPYFEKENLCLVNSEKVAWLPAHVGGSKLEEKFNLLPDFFASPKYLYEPRSAFNSKDETLLKLRAEAIAVGIEMPYGSPYEATLDAVDFVLEVKSTRNLEGLGDIEKYIANMHKIKAGAGSRAMLVWDKGFMLIKASNGYVDSAVEGKWSTLGSAKALTEFLGSFAVPAWRVATETICQQKRLDLVPHGYLGRGGNGVVFKVFDFDSVTLPLALKVVVGPEKSRLLKTELQLLEMHCKTAAAEHLVQVLSYQCIELVNVYPAQPGHPAVPAAAYLMRSVGVLPPSSEKKDKLLIVKSLVELHRLSIVHGDPRRVNVILVDGRLRWIDLVESRPNESGMLFQKDMELLLKSLLRLSREESLPEATNGVLDQYAKLLTGANIAEQLLA